MRSASRTLPPCALLALCLAACDGSGPACERARIQIGKGDLGRAEACLVAASGSEADALRASIAARRRHLEALRSRFAEIEDHIDSASAFEVHRELASLLQAEEDAAARAALEQAMSDFQDRLAARPRAPLALSVVGTAGVLGAPERGRLRQEVGVALEDRAWARAFELLAMLADLPGATADDELEALRGLSIEGAVGEARDLLQQARERGAADGPGAARLLLAGQAPRFPRCPELAFFHEAVADALRQGEASAAASPADAAGPRLVQAFLEAGAPGRDAAWSSLASLEDDELLDTALALRVDRAAATVHASPALDRLAELAELRSMLDRLRARALERIFDEDVYFYPYDPPDPTRERADYERAQRAVDAAVSALREVWDRPFAVELPPALVRAAEDLSWGVERRAARSGGSELPAGLPAYVAALPAGPARLDVRSFAWTAAEARSLARGREIRELNARAFDAARLDDSALGPQAFPDADERAMVRLVNDYRELLGRAPLAWSPRLQAACQGHSDSRCPMLARSRM